MNVSSNSPTLLHVTGRKHQCCPLDFSLWCRWKREGGEREREREGEGETEGGVCLLLCRRISQAEKNITAGKKTKTTNIPDLVWLSAPWRTEGIFQPTHGKKKAKNSNCQLTWQESFFLLLLLLFCQRTGWSLCVLSRVASRHSSLN